MQVLTFLTSRGTYIFIMDACCYFIPITPIGPITGSLVNMFGTRSVTIFGAIFASASFACSTLSPNVDVLIVLYGVFGGKHFISEAGFCQSDYNRSKLQPQHTNVLRCLITSITI